MAILVYADDETHALELEDFMHVATHWHDDGDDGDDEHHHQQPMWFGTASVQSMMGDQVGSPAF
jgi:hypothetical protein